MTILEPDCKWEPLRLWWAFFHEIVESSKCTSQLCDVSIWYILWVSKISIFTDVGGRLQCRLGLVLKECDKKPYDPQGSAGPLERPGISPIQLNCSHVRKTHARSWHPTSQVFCFAKLLSHHHQKNPLDDAQFGFFWMPGQGHADYRARKL